MSQDTIKNMAASVRQRLYNISKNSKQPLNEVIQQYTMDRFLYRLSQSQHADKFILKGGLMFKVWGGEHCRPTKDIDLLGKISNRVGDILKAMQEIANEDVNDGLTFLPESAKASEIVKDGDYKGVRVKIPGTLAGARFVVQIDTGFGDAVYPHPEIQELPAILDQPTTKLTCYSKETLIAEKFHAMIELAEKNSRMKDFYDIWFLSRSFDFKGERLGEAITQAFQCRGRAVPVVIEPLRDSFASIYQPYWNAFTKTIRQSTVPDLFSVVSAARDFLQPVCTSIHNGINPGDWKAQKHTWEQTLPPLDLSIPEERKGKGEPAPKETGDASLK
jgi:hypothetical protein